MEGEVENSSGGGLDGKGGRFLERRSGFLEIAIILFDFLFTCKLKDVVSLVIFHLRFFLFCFIKIFFSSVCLILLIAYLRGKVYKS